jgi:protein kinase C substrate 80K-H
VCPYENAMQASTSLGNWGGYEKKGAGEDEADFPHYIFKYSGGQTCWNGPARSATVVLECGE